MCILRSQGYRRDNIQKWRFLMAEQAVRAPLSLLTGNFVPCYIKTLRGDRTYEGQDIPVQSRLGEGAEKNRWSLLATVQQVRVYTISMALFTIPVIR